MSCNYFFYELGRLVGIDAIDEYSEKFGLGEATGIELSERQEVRYPLRPSARRAGRVAPRRYFADGYRAVRQLVYARSACKLRLRYTE